MQKVSNSQKLKIEVEARERVDFAPLFASAGLNFAQKLQGNLCPEKRIYMNESATERLWITETCKVPV